MTHLILASATFFVIHAFVSGTSLRFWIIDKIGLKLYIPMFAISSLVALVWMARSYGAASDLFLEPLWNFGLPGDWLAFFLVLAGFVFVVVGLATKNPTTVEQGGLLTSENPVVGILHVTRHPFLVGVALWAIAHLAVNGDPPSIVFFGTFLIVVLNGMHNIDKKRQRVYGEDWNDFAAATSIVPFAAILQGKARFELREIGILKIMIGLAAFAAFNYYHWYLFGKSVPPF